MKTKRQLLIAFSIFFAFGGASLPAADSEWSGKEKIKVEGKAKSAGTISLQVSFKPAEDGASGDPVKIEIAVSDKTKKNDVAELITNDIRAVLGDEKFKIKTSGGNNVEVKAKGDTPDFAIVMTNNSVQGISLEIDN